MPSPLSPRLLKAGLVLVDPASGAVRRVIALQYNPESLSRTLQSQYSGGEDARGEPLRLKGPATETIRLEAVIDATDQLEFPDGHPAVTEVGIQPDLAALESILNPPSGDLIAADALADTGALEIAPIESSLTLLVWSRERVVPVRVTECGITEEFFDPGLNPIRAKVSLSMKVLSVSDLGFDHVGGGVFMSYLRTRERLAGLVAPAALERLGIGGLP